MASRRNQLHPSAHKRAASKGRPPKALWPDQIEELAAIQCTMEEMAAVLGCNRSTIETEPILMQRIQIGRERGKMELRKAQAKKAIVDSSPPLQIWLGKNWLGQSDNPAENKAGALGAFAKWLENAEGKQGSEQTSMSDEDKGVDKPVDKSSN
jgi:hypothetical protein